MSDHRPSCGPEEALPASSAKGGGSRPAKTKIEKSGNSPSRSTSVGSSPSPGNSERGSAATPLPAETLYKADAMGIPEYDYPAVVVRNTFIDTDPQIPASLVGFFREREIRSAPGSRMGAPPGLEGHKTETVPEAPCEHDDESFGSGMSIPPGLAQAPLPNLVASAGAPAETSEVLRLQQLVDSLLAENQALKAAQTGATLGPAPVAPPKGLPPPPPAATTAEAPAAEGLTLAEGPAGTENGSLSQLGAAAEDPYKVKAWTPAPLPPPMQWAPMLPQTVEPPPPTVIADSCVVPQEAQCSDSLDPTGDHEGAERDSASASQVLGTKELPTLGSAGHPMGICKPCAFFHKKGCNNGVQCLFCHLCEPGEIIRRKKDKLDRQRQTTQWLRTSQHIMPMPPLVPMMDGWAPNAAFLAR